MRSRRRLSTLAAPAFVLLAAVHPAAMQPRAPSTNHAAAGVAISDITLVKASDTTAVIRSRAGALETVKVADLVGATRAVVKEITPGRLVLDDAFTGTDGKSNRAVIVIKEGERGGTRYLQRPDEPPISATKPLMVMPAAPDAAKPTPKKPPPL